MKITPLDQRRLADGKKALALGEPETTAEIRKQLVTLHEAIAALQSLDDLGSTANQSAMDDMFALEEKYNRLTARLEKEK